MIHKRTCGLLTESFFVASCILARGARFYLLAAMLRRFGAPIREFIERRLGLIAALAAMALIALYFAVKYLGANGALTTC